MPVHYLRNLRGLLLLALILIAVFSAATTPVSSQDPSGRITVNADDSHVTAAGTWQPVSTAGHHYLASSGNQDTLTLSFFGAYLEVIYVDAPQFGTLAIEVDGQVLRTINPATDGSTRYGQRAVINYLDAGEHVARIYAVTGAIAVEAFVVDALLPTTPPPLVQQLGDTDYWALELKPGTDPVALANRLGYEYLRGIADLPNIYLYRIPGTGTQPSLAASTSSRLASTPEVVWFEQQIARQQSKRPIPSDPGLANQWHLINTGQGGGTPGEDANLAGAWNLNYDGSGIIVGIVDDGMDIVHADLAPNYNASASYDYNFGDSDPSHDLPGDAHGTSVAGVVGAAEDTSLTSCGVGAAFAAQLAGLRLISTGSTDAMEADALANTLAATPGVVMISSNSWGPSDNGAILEGPGPLTRASIANQIVNGRGGKGVIYVWAGGNGGNKNDDVNADDVNADGYANSMYTIAVAATDNTGVRSSYSERGTAILVNAPSNGGTLGITTTDRTGSPGYNAFEDGDCYDSFGGTSSAAPLVSGIVALMLQANSSLTWRDVQYILVNTAEKNDPTDVNWFNNGAGRHYNHFYGFGRVDAGAAVAAAENWNNVDDAVETTSELVTVNAAIPDNNSTGVSRTYNFTTPDVGVLEHVEVVFNATHARRGDISVTLTSPMGTTITLMKNRLPDTSTAGYNNWKFMTVAFWGEDPKGVWTITVKDLRSGSTGTFGSFEIILHGLEPQDDETLLLPAGNTIATSPTFVWQYQHLAEWYRLIIRRTSNNATIFDRWYQVNVGQLTCGSGQCTLIPDFVIPTTIGDDALRWRLQHWSAAGGLGNLTAFKPFTVLAPTLNAPAGTVSLPLGDPLFQWSEITDGLNTPTWYEIYVSRPGGNFFHLSQAVSSGVACSAGTCSTRLSDLGPQYDLTTGAHTWYVRGYKSGLGYTNWSTGQNFTITASPLPQIIKGVPAQSANITTANVNFTWTHNANANKYEVYLAGPSGFVDYRQWDASTYCSGGNCAVTIPVNANGGYTWYLRGINAAGGGAWGPNDAGGNYGAVSFNVNAPLPSQITKIAPISTTVTTGAVNFSWQENANATSYELYVSGPGGWFDYHSWDSATYCTAGTCTVKILAPTNGNYTWYLRGKSPVGFGPWGPNDAGGNYGPANFTVSVGAVPQVIKNTPTQGSNVTTNAVTLTWVDTTNAAAYDLYLGGPSGFAHYQMHIPGQNAICSAGTCSITIHVPYNGAYQWYIRGWSPAGYGPWGPNDAGGDYGLRSFNVTAPLPSPLNAALLSPADNSVLANGANVTFQWMASTDTTWYGLTLINRTTGATLSTTWYSAETLGCPAGGNTCTVSKSLTPGNYRWGVVAWGPASTSVPPLTTTRAFDKIAP